MKSRSRWFVLSEFRATEDMARQIAEQKEADDL